MLLNCHTYYSFHYGTLSTEDLMQLAARNGYKTFAVTDINNTSACLDAIRLCGEFGLRAIAGIDFRNGVQQQYVGLACNNEGFRELNEHLTKHLHSEQHFESVAPEFNNAYIIYPLSTYKGWPLKPNERLGVSLRDLRNLAFSPYKNRTQDMVALQEVSFVTKKHFNAHRLLRAIDKNTLLSKLPVEEQASGNEIMLPREEMVAAYALYPHIISNTADIINNCHVSFDYGKLKSKNKQFYTSDLHNDMEMLRRECMNGLHYRYPKPSAAVMNRINTELEVIEQLHFASYYLINFDIIRYAQSQNYYYVGRGSGSNSIVAYLLRITDVDPIELDLYFERFINVHRSNAPDFDIDFSWTDRDDITRYIFDRFGRQHTALLGTYSTFQQDAVTRELGKVFGLPPGEIDRLQRPERYPDIDRTGKQILRYAELIKGFPSHLSIHSSGIIISELPVTCYSATFMPPKGYPTTQFSMLEAEDVGLFKFDILSQRGLGKIKDALGLIKENQQTEIDIHEVAKFKEDPRVKDLLREGKAIGCFYVESPGMRMLLSKLRADDYLRLVAASSIIRPGVAKSGMMREYIVRFRDETLRAKARLQLPELYDILAETYGVMVYQEDVIKVAHLFAGISLADADSLRRGMSWKFKKRDEFMSVKQKFFDNCLAKGHDFSVVAGIWTQIESFANFAFSKGHSASYAVESYQALYLKAYYPLEYMVATLNNGGGFYRKELYLHEARMHGADIQLPCINRSNAECTIDGNVIYLGLGMITGIEDDYLVNVLEERKRNGPFQGLRDFAMRVPLSLEQLRLLIRAGAFAFTGNGKKNMLWDAHTLLQPIKKTAHKPGLFAYTLPSFELPELVNSFVDNAFDEIELLGFPMCSPFLLLRDDLPGDIVPAKTLRNHIGKHVRMLGYLITVKPTITSKKERMNFGTFIDQNGDWIDTVHFPPSAKQYPFIGNGCYIIEGKVTEEYDFVSVEVSYMKRMATVDREIYRADTPQVVIDGNDVVSLT